MSSGCLLAKESCCGRFTEEKCVLCSHKLLSDAKRNPQMLLVLEKRANRNVSTLTEASKISFNTMLLKCK